jgi:hypothetical protein
VNEGHGSGPGWRLLQMTGRDNHVSTVARFCRGCGKELPAGSSLLFHPDCRRADKRRRVADQRRREEERREEWLRRQRCPKCGAGLEQLAFSNRRKTPEYACDASPTPEQIPAPTDSRQGQEEQTVLTNRS